VNRLSYDLKFFRVPDGLAPQAAYEHFMEQEEMNVLSSSGDKPISDSAKKQMESVAATLKAWRPEFQQFQPDRALAWIELNDEQLALQLIISPDAVDATVSYFGDRAEEVIETLVGCSKVLTDAAGYIAYDPQLGRQVTASDRDEMIAQYKRIDTSILHSVPAALPNLRNASRPWWKFW